MVEQTLAKSSQLTLSLIVLDWDRVGTSDKLGRGRIDVINIEPFQATTMAVPLREPGGEEHGSINVRMVFRPEVSQYEVS